MPSPVSAKAKKSAKPTKARKGRRGFFAELPVSTIAEINRRADMTDSPAWKVVADAIPGKKKSKAGVSRAA